MRWRGPRCARPRRSRTGCPACCSPIRWRSAHGVSRPEEALFLSFRSSDEEGGPQQASPFLDDVRALFTDELWEDRGRRLLAEITWPPAEAPTPHELRRSQAAGEERPAPAPLGAPVDARVLALLAGRDRESA